MDHYHLQETLTSDLFRNPASQYRGTPFWAWNGKLDEEEMIRQIDLMHQMGFGGFHIHSRTGMSTPYLSEEFMGYVKRCVSHAKEKGMLAWLYDEDRCPSGFAGGLVTREKDCRARYLVFTSRTNAESAALGDTKLSDAHASRSCQGSCIAAYDIVLDEDQLLRSYRRIDASDKAEGVKWYAYLESPCENPWYNLQTYVNTLDKKAIDRFIEITHEAYKKAVGDDFDTVIPSIFTDEPQFSHKTRLHSPLDRGSVILPWTDDLPGTYRSAFNEDILEQLPLLVWESEGDLGALARYRYHDHITERFVEAFADNIGEWCRQNHLMLTGHMMGESDLESQTAATGEAMRSYRSFDIPGVDILCDDYEYTVVKQAQSAARQYGRVGVLSELYGVTNWDFDFRGHKLQGDWQAALGVTVRVPHLAWLTMRGEAKRDYPASIHYQSPWYTKYALVEDHFARLNTALTRGKPEVRIAVIHPVESYWLHWGPETQTALVRNQMEEHFQEIAKWLLTGVLDFDFICEANLPHQCPVGGSPLRVGEMAYDVVLLPHCETIRSTTLERLLAFGAAGGRILVLGDLPERVDARRSEMAGQLRPYSKIIPFDKASIYMALEPFRLVEFRDEAGRLTTNLVYQLRRDGKSRWLFIAQGVKSRRRDIPALQKVRIAMEGHYRVELYDTLTGDIIPVDTESEGGKTILHRDMYQHDSLLLRLNPPEAPGTASKPARCRNKTDTRCWKPVLLPETVPVTLEEPNVLLLDVAEYALDDGAYRPEEEVLRADNRLRGELGWPLRMDEIAQPWVMPPEPPAHRMRMRFAFRTEVALKDIKLALEDAGAALIRLDGDLVPSVTDGWFTDRCIHTVRLPAFSAGMHTLKVEIPYGHNAAAEWCYLLGDFGVRLNGREKVIVPPVRRTGFGDVTTQGMPFYGGNLCYHLEVELPDGDVRVHVPQYRGALVEVSLDGRHCGEIIYAPYDCVLSGISAGRHTLTLKVYGNRFNSFGQLHLCDPDFTWMGPDSYRTTGDAWCPEYRPRPFGILTSPGISSDRGARK